MGKLIFKYGTMGSGKTLECLTKIYHERSKGKTVLTVKPSIDKRSKFIKSRIGLKIKADCNESFLIEKKKIEEYDFIIVDEAQFLAKESINLLRLYANNGIEVICYGIKSDFKTNLFPGAKRLFEIADNIIEIESTCKYCHHKAIYNMRLINNKPIFEGEPIQIGGDESYVAVCSKCYLKKEIEDES